MRSVLKTAILASALVAAAPAVAQVYGQSGIPAPMHMRTGGPLVAGNAPHMNPQMNPQHGSGRWGGSVNGRWHGGVQAPGGWGGYRRPSRGYQLDRYWMSGNFQIPDYTSFGLQAPPNGYFWVRYYDDAVLVDSYGRVRDSVSGIAWADADAYADADYGSASASAAAAGGGGGYGGGQIQRVEPNDGYYEDDSGYGEQRYGAPYPEPRGGYAPPMDGGPSAAHVRCRPGCQGQGGDYAGGGYGRQDYSGGGSSYASGGGYYGGGATTTTVTIQYAPVVTTTTTTTEEVVEEESSSAYETTYVSRPRTKLVRRHYAPTKRLRRHGCGC